MDKLRKKYKNLKSEWNSITNRAKQGSGLTPVAEPPWFAHINGIFSETNAEVNLVSHASDLSFVNEQQETDEDEDDVNEDVSLRTLAGLSSDGNTSGDDKTGDVCETAGNSSRGA